jgi:FlaA1/EpsC-like NDP-sugar epimerase
MAASPINNMQKVVGPAVRGVGVGALINRRKPLILLSQAVLVALSYWGSFLLRFDFHPAWLYEQMLLLTIPAVLIIKLAVFQHFGLLRGWWRYIGMNDALDIVKATASSTAILAVLMKIVIRVPGYPRSVLPVDALLTIVLVGGARFAVRAYTEMARECEAQRDTIVIGAGAAGRNIVHELKRNPHLGLKPVGFVDDDRSKHGIRIEGVPVLGGTERLHELIRQCSAETVLIAIPSASGEQVERFVTRCRECKVDFKILAPIRSQIQNGSGAANAVRSLRLEDLLGREPVQVDLAEIRRQLKGKVLLVTGAGGSIGSELARQVARFEPRELLLIDRSENSLFQLGLELSAQAPHQPFTPRVADIQDVSTMREIFALHRPEVVFHAAAYKHVPMMERHCFQAVANNVFGTYNVALLARQFGAQMFVMISSDKAVNPTNIMGVTKRVAELIILGLHSERTRYVAVRFGNVLGSNGSVVPIFQQQIRDGGPVTVTHPDAKRYFMTIPEAVQLVLQASTIGRNSEIFVLDMGKPIRIVDLAHTLIRLAGLSPNDDIPIAFTGLRPGEKLFEELVLEGEGIKPTTHPKIRVLDGGHVSFQQVRAWLDELSTGLDSRNVSAVVQTLRRMVPEYKPSEEVLSLSELDRHDVSLTYRKARAELWYALGDAA